MSTDDSLLFLEELLKLFLLLEDHFELVFEVVHFTQLMCLLSHSFHHGGDLSKHWQKRLDI